MVGEDNVERDQRRESWDNIGNDFSVHEILEDSSGVIVLSVAGQRQESQNKGRKGVEHDFFSVVERG